MTDPVTAPTFATQARALADSAQAGDAVVVAVARDGAMVLHVRFGSAADLVQIARSVVHDALAVAEGQDGEGTLRLRREITLALATIPYPDEDEDGDDEAALLSRKPAD